VTSAEKQRGVFHDNVFLSVVLESPHFQDGALQSKHDVLVMTSLDDGVRSFAIDEFPSMDADAVEEFWIKRVEEHRKLREEVFTRLERDYADSSHTGNSPRLHMEL
jgi:hypothetical protein